MLFRSGSPAVSQRLTTWGWVTVIAAALNAIGLLFFPIANSDTLATLSALSDSELDDTRDGKLPAFAPTVGALLTITGAHALGHYGQFVAVRRMLKKPVLF